MSAIYLPDGRQAMVARPTQTAMPTQETCRIIYTPKKIYANMPCHHCTHLHEKHVYLYTIVKGVAFSDRFACAYPGCRCGERFRRTIERVKALKKSDFERFDAEANIISQSLYADL